MPRHYRVSESSETNLTFPEELEVEKQTPIQTPNPANPSCHVSYVNAFIAVLAALVLAVGVGLIVGLAHPALTDRPLCPTTPEPTPPTTLDPEVEWQQCVNMSWERGDCLPGLVCTTLKPPVTSPIEQTTTTSTVAPKVNMRLPNTLKPTHYNLLLQPDLYSTAPEKFVFTGTVEIFLTCVENTNQVVLHANNLIDVVLDTIELTDASGNQLEIIEVNRDIKKEFLLIRTSSSLTKGSDFILYLEFSGPLRNDLTGIYYSSYEIENNTTYLVASQLQPTGARKVFPCFDEPAMKATFNVSIDRKRPLTTMSNTDVYKTDTLTEGWYRDHFSTTPPMSTYLLAFIISDFQCVPSNTTDHKQVNVCARPNVIAQTEFAATIAGEMQQFYEEYHNISLPLPKTGHVGVPDFNSGAMENWGLIVYRETALLYDADTSTAHARQRVATVIAHELAHMWFGDLVTPSWWEDLWLNEGFASYLETKGVNHLFPDWGMADNAIKDDVLRAMAVDSLVTSHPLDQPAETPAEINELFDTIAYSKGASVIRMMEFFLGEDTFRWGLANYLNDRKFESAHHSDLFHFLTEQAQKDKKDINVTSVMNTWVVQTGYPVVTVKYDAPTGQVALSQKRFLLNPTADGEDSSVWQIPISVVTGPDAKWDSPTTTWLKQKTGEIHEDISPGAKWIIVNVKFQGFYRVNYDDKNWNALTEQLLSNHSKIEVANRIQIIDDSFNLGRGGETSQLSALKIAKYLKDEKDYLPWVGAQTGFTYLSDMLDLTSDYGLLMSFVQALVENLYTELGWEDNINQPHLQRLLRSTVLQMACGYGIKDCQEVAEAKFNETMIGESIPSGIQPLVYCQGVRKGGEKEWDFVFNKYKHSQSGAEKKTFLQALACSREHLILQRYLILALEEVEIRRQDFEMVLEAVAGNPLGREMAWDFFVTNWNTIFERFGGSSFTLSDLAASVTATFSTQKQLDKLTAFLQDHPDQGTASATFRNAVETTKANLDWRSKNEKLLFDWLRKESSHS